jgi:hypothetical protein
MLPVIIKVCVLNWRFNDTTGFVNFLQEKTLWKVLVIEKSLAFVNNETNIWHLVTFRHDKIKQYLIFLSLKSLENESVYWL